MRKCSRADRTCSLGARDKGGLILTSIRMEKWVDLGAKSALMWTGFGCGGGAEYVHKEGGESDVSFMVHEQ